MRVGRTSNNSVAHSSDEAILCFVGRPVGGGADVGAFHNGQLQATYTNASIREVRALKVTWFLWRFIDRVQIFVGNEWKSVHS